MDVFIHLLRGIYRARKELSLNNLVYRYCLESPTQHIEARW